MEEEKKSEQEPVVGSSEGTQAEQKADEQQPEAAPEISKDAKMWAMFCHLAGLAAYVLPFVGNIIGPLIIWQVKKDEHPFIDANGKEAVNFQISITIYAAVSFALFALCVGPFLLAGVLIFDLVFMIIRHEYFPFVHSIWQVRFLEHPDE